MSSAFRQGVAAPLLVAFAVCSMRICISELPRERDPSDHRLRPRYVAASSDPDTTRTEPSAGATSPAPMRTSPSGPCALSGGGFTSFSRPTCSGAWLPIARHRAVAPIDTSAPPECQRPAVAEHDLSAPVLQRASAPTSNDRRACRPRRPRRSARNQRCPRSRGRAAAGWRIGPIPCRSRRWPRAPDPCVRAFALLARTARKPCGRHGKPSVLPVGQVCASASWRCISALAPLIDR